VLHLRGKDSDCVVVVAVVALVAVVVVAAAVVALAVAGALSKNPDCCLVWND